MTATPNRLNTELAAMLDAYDTARRADDAREQLARDDARQFLESFARLRREVVRPVFETAGAILSARGHGFTIREQEFAPEHAGGAMEASITLHVTPAGMEGAAASDEHRRELCIATRHYSRAVTVMNGAVPESGSLAGARGSCTLAQVTPQLVEDEVLKLIAALVRRT